jgi:hypothetical protein
MEDNRNRVILPIYVNNIRTLSDGSVKVELVTQELSATSMAGLFQLHRTQGFALLSTESIDDLTALDDEQIEAFGGKAKTQSQRLRAVFYKIWEQTGKGEQFDSFYKREMELLISKYKLRID